MVLVCANCIIELSIHGAKLLAWHPDSVYISPVGTVGLGGKEDSAVAT